MLNIRGPWPFCYFEALLQIFATKINEAFFHSRPRALAKALIISIDYKIFFLLKRVYLVT